VNEPQKLNYETPKPRKGIQRPPDWRRRLLVGLIAAPIIFFVTLEAARRTQSSAVISFERGRTESVVSDLQHDIDEYTRTTGIIPTKFTDVPEINQRASWDPKYLVDQWGTPYLLTTVNGKLTVMSYGADKAPGGTGLNADITDKTLYQSPDLISMSQFIQYTRLTPVILICVGNALLIFSLAFVGMTDTREPRNLAMLLVQLTIKAIIALFVASIIAAVHAPSGH
jgi:Type II secretion system (T2SS), protein G